MPRRREYYLRAAARPIGTGATNAALTSAGRARSLCIAVHGDCASEPIAGGKQAIGERIVLCPPLAEEHGYARSALHRLAARLGAAGHRTLIYDPSGHGDSEGEFVDLVVDDLLIDLAACASHPALGEAATVIIGFRFGAAVSARAIDTARVRPKRLILIDPILDGALYARELLRKNVATQIASFGRTRRSVEELRTVLARGETIDVDGHPITPALYQGLLESDGVAALATESARRVPVDVVMIRPRLPKPPADVIALTRLRPISLHPIEALEPWKEDRRHVVSDVPELAQCILELLVGCMPLPSVAHGGGVG
jgi:pimeloyl-ACP methyl ester carboxylesterase